MTDTYNRSSWFGFKIPAPKINNSNNKLLKLLLVPDPAEYQLYLVLTMIGVVSRARDAHDRIFGWSSRTRSVSHLAKTRETMPRINCFVNILFRNKSLPARRTFYGAESDLVTRPRGTKRRSPGNLAASQVQDAFRAFLSKILKKKK